MKITKTGQVTVLDGQIRVEGFEFDGYDDPEATCRKAAMLAATWAIGELQRELLATIEKPGGGYIAID
jgi:hypothetical protein